MNLDVVDMAVVLILDRKGDSASDTFLATVKELLNEAGEEESIADTSPIVSLFTPFQRELYRLPPLLSISHHTIHFQSN